MSDPKPTIWLDVHGDGGFPPADAPLPGDVFIDAGGRYWWFSIERKWISRREVGA